MKSHTTSADITKKVEEKHPQFAMDMAKDMLKAQGVDFDKIMSGIKKCIIFGDPIMGANIDLIDNNRNPQKVCMPCVFLAVDYYISYKNGQKKGEK